MHFPCISVTAKGSPKTQVEREFKMDAALNYVHHRFCLNVGKGVCEQVGWNGTAE